MNTWIMLSPIVVVLVAALYFIYAVRKRDKKNEIKRQIIASGDRGEHKVRAVMGSLESPKSKYQVYHNIRLGPDEEHTNEYDTVVIGPNGIFHVETKNYGGERGGIIDIDSQDNWILHKRSGYSKLLTNPIGQVDSHEYRLRGFLMKVVGVKNLPTQGILVLSCDKITLRQNQKKKLEVPIMNRHQLVDYIKNYKQGNITIYPRTIKRICRKIEGMNKMAKAN